CPRLMEEGLERTRGARERLAWLRLPLGVIFLTTYAYSALEPGHYGRAVFVGVGTVLYVLSMP
ncbi:MAG TPA: hypothetical protein VE225_01675, partial [Rubrobacteraceae bacterium]|nr:hypothetical protein [Rubrobacteraceae bacterium]